MKKQKKLTIFLALFTSVSVNASHCKYLNVKSANEAFKELSKLKGQGGYPIIDRFCKECGDTYIKPIVLDSLEYRPYQVKGYASVLINGAEMDFAYLYLEGENLGAKYDCETSSAKNLFTGK